MSASQDLLAWLDNYVTEACANAVAPVQASLNDATDQIASLQEGLATCQANNTTLQGQLASKDAELAVTVQQLTDMSALAASLQDQLAACQAGQMVHPLANVFLVGASKDANGDVSVLETKKRVGVHRMYWQLNELDKAIAAAKADHAAGRMPVYTVKVGKPEDSAEVDGVAPTKEEVIRRGWAAVASGARDAEIQAWLDAFGALGFTCILGFHHEPENDIGDGVPITPWVQMQQHIAPMIHAKPNLLFAGCLIGYPQVFNNNAVVQTTGLPYSLDKVWPGDGVWDVLGLDPYNSYGMYPVKYGTGSVITKWSNMTPYYKTFDDWAELHQHPDRPLYCMIMETGISDWAYQNPASYPVRTFYRDQINALKTFKWFRGCIRFDSFENSRAHWDTNTIAEKRSDMCDSMLMGD